MSEIKLRRYAFFEPKPQYHDISN